MIRTIDYLLLSIGAAVIAYSFSSIIANHILPNLDLVSRLLDH